MKLPIVLLADLVPSGKNMIDTPSDSSFIAFSMNCSWDIILIFRYPENFAYIPSTGILKGHKFTICTHT